MNQNPFTNIDSTSVIFVKGVRTITNSNTLICVFFNTLTRNNP